jgi:membrane protease YdiL (CAAX protease family)
MLAVPLFAMAGNQVMLLVFGGAGGQLEMLASAIGGQTGAMAVAIVAFTALIPAFVEETLFRGYVQRRLLERWPPAAAIGCSSLLFALAHVDLHHATFAIFPGIWFGIVAWRCGSTWPAMLCHATMNLFGSLGMMFGKESETTPWVDPGFLGILSLFIVAFLTSLAVMKHTAPREDGAA